MSRHPAVHPVLGLVRRALAFVAFLAPIVLLACSKGGGGGSSSGPPPVVVIDQSPVAVDDAVEVEMNSAVEFDARVNDSDPDGDPLEVIGVTAAAEGTASINGDGTLHYSPDPDRTGHDAFTYTIGDGRGRFATASVSVRIDYVRGLPIERASVATGGTQGNEDSWMAAIAAGGRFVAFASTANDLVAGAPAFSILLRDRLTGQTTLASQSSAGVPGTGSSQQPAISADGRFVAFMSWDGNLVTGDTNGVGDIFVRDTQDGTTTRVSVAAGGGNANADSFSPSLSADGRCVAFVSYASNLVPLDANGHGCDVFVHDRTLGTTRLASIDAAGIQIGGGAFDDGPSISADGTRVAFSMPGRILVRDLTAGQSFEASRTPDGANSDGPSILPALSADGRSVAYSSLATNLVTGDSNGVRDVFVHDLQTGVTTRVSVAAGGEQANGAVPDLNRPAISGDGRFVAFVSDASNLVAADGNGTIDVFVRDRQAGTTVRINVDATGAEANGPSADGVTVSMSADGAYVAFSSFATNLVGGDTNGYTDVFVAPDPQMP